MTENKELLMAYDRNMNPIGPRTRAEIHANAIPHRTIRVWTIVKDTVWFQRRAATKSLFPGKFDPSATGHVDFGETTLEAAVREYSEETGVTPDIETLVHAGDMPFPFTRPDGALDNEIASVYLSMPETVPCFEPGPELAGMHSMSIRDYAALVRTGTPGGMSGHGTVTASDFCCPDPQELDLILAAAGMKILP